MTSVTVLGASNQTVSLRFDTEETTRLAQLLANQITTGVLDGSIVAASDKTGGPPPVPAGKTGEFVQTRSGLVTLPNGYATLVETAANAVVFGNTMSDQKVLSGTGSNLTFISAGGSGTVVAGGDHNRISLAPGGTGDWLISTGNGDDIINAQGSGQHTISAGGGRNAILLGTGEAIVQSEGDDTVSMAGASATIDASAGGNDLVFGGSGDLFFVGGAGGATIMGGAGSTTYYGGMHDAPVRGADDDDDDRRGRGRRRDDDDDDRRGRRGRHDDDDDDHRRGGGGRGRDPVQIVHGGRGGDNYLFAGSGAATLFGGGDGDQLYAYGEVGQMLVGSGGYATLSAALNWGNNTIVGGSGDETIIGGTGRDVIIAGDGSDTIFATDGARDVFALIQGEAGGTLLVQNIYDARDVRIDLIDYGRGEEAYALSHQTTDGSSVTVSLTDGTTITFENITHLTGRNFV